IVLGLGSGAFMATTMQYRWLLVPAGIIGIVTATTISETSAHGPRRGSKALGSPATDIRREKLTGSLLDYHARAKTRASFELPISQRGKFRRCIPRNKWARCTRASALATSSR